MIDDLNVNKGVAAAMAMCGGSEEMSCGSSGSRSGKGN